MTQIQIAREFTVGAIGSYYTVVIPWESDRARRTEWHPTHPADVLTRGAFESPEEAAGWVAAKLGVGATYSLRECPVFEEVWN